MLLSQQTIEFNEPVWKVVFDGDEGKIGVCCREGAESDYFVLNSDNLEVLGSIGAPDLGGVEVLQAVIGSEMVFDVFPDLTNPSQYDVVKLDIGSGEIELIDNYIGMDSHVLVPDRYLQDTDYFNKVARFIEDRTSRKATAAIDYMEVQNLLLVSYYLYHETNLRQELAIFDIEGKILFSEVLDRNLQAIGTESFSLFEGSLFFIQDRYKLVKIKLK